MPQMAIIETTPDNVCRRFWYYSIVATTSISTNAPFGKDFTATADLAGNGSVKNSA